MKPGRRAGITTAFVALTASAALVQAGCATTIDPEATTTVAAGGSTSTTAFVPNGSTSELLDELMTAAAGLSEAIVENEGQRDLLAQIDIIWAAARPGVEDAAPDLLPAFDRVVALMRTGVDRRAPADADKALNNVRFLVAALPAE